MSSRKLDVSTGAGGQVAVKRVMFDSHVDGCRDCVPVLCAIAQMLWRSVCVEALREQHRNEPVGGA